MGINRSYEADIHDLKVQMLLLSGSINEFRAIKHDFYNILQTYNGYLEVGYLEVGNLEAFRKYHESVVKTTVMAGDSLELSKWMCENPAIISLLLSKKAYAEHENVGMNFNLRCSLLLLLIDELALCRLCSCSLDNAIETARETV